jgi:two-component system, OmpR family, response regulator
MKKSLQQYTILLVEKSDNLRTVLKDYLEMFQYEVNEFQEGIPALKSISKFSYDLCVLDLNVEQGESFSLFHDLKKVDPFLPVIFISSKTDKETRIQAFKEGCDDFMIKPFSIEELSLRIEAILRRTQLQHSKQSPNEDILFYFADFKFNFTTLELIHPLKKIRLTKKEAEMLKLFCLNINTLIPRNKFVREVWGEEKLQMSRSMDVYITRLRKYLKIDTAKSEHVKGVKQPVVDIINIHGSGYIFKVNE